MKIRLTALTVLAGCFAVAVPASAQTTKPGLWELNTKMQSGNPQVAQAMAQMQKQMASMPPEQRKMMEDMMAQKGLSMSGGSDGGMLVKMCITKEMAARKQIPMQTQGNCTHQQSPMVGNTMTMSFSCTDPVSSGDGQVTFHGDSGYTMSMKMMSTVKGKPETMNLDATGHWLGADCGNIKPMGQAPKTP